MLGRLYVNLLRSWAGLSALTWLVIVWGASQQTPTSSGASTRIAFAILACVGAGISLRRIGIGGVIVTIGILGTIFVEMLGTRLPPEPLTVILLASPGVLLIVTGLAQTTPTIPVPRVNPTHTPDRATFGPQGVASPTMKDQSPTSSMAPRSDHHTSDGDAQR